MSAHEYYSTGRVTAIATKAEEADEGLVADYVARLEVALDDEEAFPEVYAELENDPSIRRAELLAIAREFSRERATSRTDALDKIWYRHESLMGHRARLRRNEGRTAG